MYWSHRASGNANVVFESPPTSTYPGMLLRIPKSIKQESSGSDEPHGRLRARQIIRFHRIVVSRLLNGRIATDSSRSSSIFPESRLLQIKKMEIQNFSKTMAQHVGVEAGGRQAEMRLMVVGLLMEDYCRFLNPCASSKSMLPLPDLSLEIKPKWVNYVSLQAANPNIRLILLIGNLSRAFCLALIYAVVFANTLCTAIIITLLQWKRLSRC